MPLCRSRALSDRGAAGCAECEAFRGRQEQFAEIILITFLALGCPQECVTLSPLSPPDKYHYWEDIQVIKSLVVKASDLYYT